MTNGRCHGNVTFKMSLSAKLSATALFVSELVKGPRQVGAVLPSSQKLAAAMAKWLPAGINDHVIELGPGTGVVTEALMARGLPPEKLLAIEMSAKMADHLRGRFPRAKIVTGDAFRLEELVREHLGPHGRVAMVFSSLPLMNFEPAAADSLARQIKGLLAPRGKLVQYSYHVANKHPKAAEHFEFVATDLIWLNVPPARVMVYQK